MSKKDAIQMIRTADPADRRRLNSDTSSKHLLKRLDHFLNIALRKTDSGCLEWPGTDNGTGYGQFLIGGRKIYTHRLMFSIRKGPIGVNEQVLHNCDNPRCVNVRHLFLGGYQSNTEDKIAKRRHNFGQVNGMAKLSNRQVSEIKSLLPKFDNEKLAAAYQVSAHTISNIRAGRRWGLVP